jgi:hypothetical protein
MRLTLLVVLLVACGNDPKPHADASITLADAKPIDAAIDAPPDAGPSMNITTACMHACDAIATCFGEQPDPDCYSECAVDLADCTDQEVAAIDACSTEECGDEKDSPIITCITQVSCVDMAATSLRR